MEILFEIDGIEFTLFDIIIVIFAVFLLIRKLFMFDIEIYSEIFPCLGNKNHCRCDNQRLNPTFPYKSQEQNSNDKRKENIN